MTLSEIITQVCRQNNLPEIVPSHIHLNTDQVEEIYHWDDMWKKKKTLLQTACSKTNPICIDFVTNYFSQCSL